MILVDGNVLLYAVNEDAPQHAQAKRWLDAALVGTETIGFAWIVALAFLRVSTRAAAFAKPFGAGEAIDQLRDWLAQPPAVVVEPTVRHLEVVADLLAESGTAGDPISDAHLAALALERDATVASYDSDFGRFARVRWVSPAV